MEPPAMTAADAWALEASALPIAFSQVREDPRLDLEIARSLPPGATAMMIASGGETAVCLARLPLARLILVDMNPAQLALTRCRFHLAEHFPPAESMRLLGHAEMPPEERRETWAGIFRKLGLAENVLGSPDLIASLGPDHCGRYEAAFAELRRLLALFSAEVGKFLNSTQPTPPPAAIDSAFASALRLENLVALFGEGATQNPRSPFHEHFPTQLRGISARMPSARNPWIWQLLAGKFPPSTPYDWLLSDAPPAVQPEYIRSSMLAALESAPESSVDFLHLSNILDWLSPDEARETLAAARRALRPGGRLIIRQLNSSLDIPSLFPGLAWDAEQGRRLRLADRSFFYPEILLATRP
jgi:S-adenosylmethionine-diacylglycerol 3-amino-3-carboxypropyl transferase